MCVCDYKSAELEMNTLYVCARFWASCLKVHIRKDKPMHAKCNPSITSQGWTNAGQTARGEQWSQSEAAPLQHISSCMCCPWHLSQVIVGTHAFIIAPNPAMDGSPWAPLTGPSQATTHRWRIRPSQQLVLQCFHICYVLIKICVFGRYRKASACVTLLTRDFYTPPE